MSFVRDSMLEQIETISSPTHRSFHSNQLVGIIQYNHTPLVKLTKSSSNIPFKPMYKYLYDDLIKLGY